MDSGHPKCGSFDAGEVLMMPSRRDATQEDARFRILRILQQNPEMSQRELSDAVGIGLGSVNYCINAMVEKGFVKLGNFSAAHDKRRYAYVLTPKGLAEKAQLTKRFLIRKTAEYEALKIEIEALHQEIEPEVFSGS